MLGELRNFFQELRANTKIKKFDEVAAKQGIILRILHLLGWNTFKIDEVTPEYSVGTRKVDYSLRIKKKNKIFLEAKKPSEDLDKHEEQLLDYSFRQGVELAILTNGIEWWFYLPMKNVDWKARKFYAIDINEQKLDEVASKFIELLSKNNVQSGKANENAESLFKGEVKRKTVEETLYKAWNKIISEPDSTLIDLLVETTEKLCGYRPQNDEASAILTNYRRALMLGLEEPKSKKRKKVRVPPINAGRPYITQ